MVLPIPGVKIPGLSRSESASLVCRALDYYDPSVPLEKAVREIRRTAWPDIERSVSGGLQHYISVDNGASYAELWGRGGSWYAVTGAPSPSGETFMKSARWDGIYEIPGVFKGMPAEEAAARFLDRLFSPPLARGHGGCNCGGSSR